MATLKLEKEWREDWKFFIQITDEEQKKRKKELFVDDIRRIADQDMTPPSVGAIKKFRLWKFLAHKIKRCAIILIKI